MSDDFLLEDEGTIEPERIYEQPKKAVVMVGRMNPPTLGHYKVIDAMKAFIRKNKDLKLDAKPIVVIIQGEKSSKDKTKNPLTGEERKSFMENSGLANGVTFMIAPSAIKAFGAVREAGFEPVAIAAGTDRADKYLHLLDKYFTREDGSIVKHYLVPGLERDADSDEELGEDAYDHIIADIKDGQKVPVSMVSASLARYAALQNNLAAFAHLTGLSGKRSLAEKMMKKIQDAQTKEA